MAHVSTVSSMGIPGTVPMDRESLGGRNGNRSRDGSGGGSFQERFFGKKKG